MSKRSNLLLWGGIFLILGCDKDIQYTFLNFKAQLVVNASISIEDGLIVRLSRSVPPGGDEVYFKDLQVKDALVQVIAEDGKTFALIHSEKGTYLPDSTFKPANRIKYVLKVSHRTYGNIESDSVIIPQSNISDTVIATITDKLSINDEQLIQYKINLQDPENTQNYYRFVFKNIYATVNRKTTASNSFLRNPSSTSACSYFSYFASKFIGDECFNGKPVTLIFDTEIEKLFIAPGANYILPSDMSVEIIYLSKEAFEYYRSRKVPEDFEHTFSDPLPLASNVKGGLGMFVAYTSRQFVFKVPK